LNPCLYKLFRTDWLLTGHWYHTHKRIRVAYRPRLTRGAPL
jgi:hypothetical protein